MGPCNFRLIDLYRRRIGSYVWIVYIAIWISMIFVVPRFFPSFSGYGYFLPFFFFFPFFRRRGRRTSPKPTTTTGEQKSNQDSTDSYADSMLADVNQATPYSIRNYAMYAIGAAIIIIGVILIYFKVV